MSETGERPIRDVNEIGDLEPEVIEFCHMLARILARSAGRSSHQADNRTHELNDDLSMISRDL